MSITTDSTAVDSAVATLETVLTTLRTTVRTTEVARGRDPAGPQHLLPLLEIALASRLARLLPTFFTSPSGTSETLQVIAQRVTGA